MISFGLKPFIAMVAIATSVAVSSLLYGTQQENGLFPNEKIGLFFAPQWISFKVSYNDILQVRDARNLQCCYGFGVRFASAIGFSGKIARLPIRLDKPQDIHIIIAQDKCESCLCLPKSFCRGCVSPQVKTRFPVAESRQPMAESIPIDVKRKGRDRNDFSHACTSGTSVVRASGVSAKRHWLVLL